MNQLEKKNNLKQIKQNNTTTPPKKFRNFNN
jgi:hypothetical protein